ncbi:hypothetical protein AAFF_G00430180 [Aldrovandia affinis]|uniref:Zona pellucida sperm-binding protein 3 n=1 Tax=Aldrovandia affinis TaxID=143900 RepID=A0AAD7WJC9_9TELE|nr:hypothetical protein AAFF_G00430180 [Aldrovandia affinis]
MVIAMTVYRNFCIVWSVVSLLIAGRIEAYRSAPTSLTEGWRKSSYLPDPLGAGFSPRAAQSTKVSTEGPVELSDFQTPLRVPQVIERLHLTEEQTPGVLPRSGLEMIVTTAPTPAPQTEPDSLQEVSVTCSGTELTVRVQKHFYGFTPTDSELTLGRACKSTGVHDLSGDLLFTYPLASCNSKQEKTPGYVLYKYVLRYVPLPTNLTIRRAHGLNVDIQCRIKRFHHVHQLSVHPTWVTPTRKTLKGLLPGYGIQTMSAGWAGLAPSNVFLLGQRVHFQAFALHLPPGGRLYVDRCHASISGQPEASPKHSVIENFGCMVDSKINGSNSGFSPQRTNGTIDFVLDAFQFLPKSTAEVFLHCQLLVTTGDPSPTAKSCTYSQEEGSWKEVSGRHWDCTCCDSRCLNSKARQSMYKGFLSSGPLMFTTKDPEPKISFTQENAEPETSDPWVSATHAKPKTTSAPLSLKPAPWDDLNQGNAESKTSDPWDGFSQGNTEHSFNHRSAVSFEARPERADELEQYEDPEWQEDYEYANVYEEDQYSGEGSHIPSLGTALQAGEEGVGGKEAGSEFWKGVMEMRVMTGEGKEPEVGEGSMFGVGEGPMFRMAEEEHLHYGLSSGIGEVIFLRGSDWLPGGNWDDRQAQPLGETHLKT